MSSTPSGPADALSDPFPHPRSASSDPPVRVELLAVSELLSGRYTFRLPWFQRAYAWQTQHISRLLANVVAAMRGGASHYMLGKVMLATSGTGTDTALVDGQQRLLSLTILFAVLRDLEADANEQEWLQALIADPISDADMTRPAYRLAPQAALSEFLEAHVQCPGSTSVEPEEDRMSLSETEQNVVENRDHLRSELTSGDVSDAERRDLARFLASKCYVVVSTTDGEEQAWEMLRVEEETRLAFNETAYAKASLLGVMPADQRTRSSVLWDECEHILGSADTHALLGHVRTLHMRKRSSAPLETDICRNFALNRAGAAFMEDVFLPHARSLAAIRLPNAAAQALAPKIVAAITKMSWVNDQVWVPAALHWMSTRGVDDPAAELFFRRLERLVWVMRLAGVDPDRQENRIIRLLRQIDTVADVTAMRELDIEGRLRNPALKALRSVSFRAKKFSPVVLRRLSVELGDDIVELSNDETLTIEHILPLSPPPDRLWHQDFRSRAFVKAYTNRLGNLTLLTFDENQQAGSSDWDVKRTVLANSRVALSRQAAEQAQWRIAEIDARTERLIATLFTAWELPF
ncbi:MULTISPECIES: DUF262 domain-containing HNH endonuclease family protein [Filomicrobium]|uniref:DUF262 domain-containing protein n=1 Tax=Filomicrobium insigne TaxID=418854 RepID=A0A1H0HA88_9HYPH|nr:MULTISPECIES: DUF262 domain-containing HNH endonuclease family protein [Filomicrobium]MCV0367814.1 DUF262 domain-containing HNH endonuclease family protein [Filomicrobium sp.]SDO16038.1 Protein of unknown function DUF262 [Filomicrobium insigne]